MNTSSVNSLDLGLLGLAALAWVVVGLAALLVRFFGRDEMFTGLPPGLIPPDPATAPRERVRSASREYDGEIAVAFSPPAGLTPGLVGTVIDGSVDSRDITATLVDLAVRGHLTITAVPADQEANPARKRFAKRPEGEVPKVDWVIGHPTGTPRDELAPFEQSLIQGVLGGAESVRMSQLGDSGLQALRHTQAGFYADVMARGWYKRHPRKSGGWGCLPIGAGVLLAVLMAMAGRSIQAYIAAVIALGAGIALSRVTRGRSPRTAEGTAVRIQALGFKKYLATAEAGQFRFEEAAGIFSRYLPYAMVFGVAQHWAKVFGDVANLAQVEGASMSAFDLTWFDVIDLGTDVLWWDSLDGSLDVLSGLGDGLGAAAEGLGSVAEGLGDFMGSLDFLDGIGDGCDIGGCLDF